MKIYASALLSGMVFGLGLAISGMTDPANIQGFLDITRDWRPHLALVMGSALVVSGLFFQIVVPRLKGPLFAASFMMPLASAVDQKLIGGAALFGLGWGISGLCPGPAIAGLAYLEPKILGFIVAMALGFKVADWLSAQMVPKQSVQQV
jgi:uncharacterized membrane protein YedE/YeeE